MYHNQATVEFASLARKRKNLLTYPASSNIFSHLLTTMSKTIE